jgi:tetratricopeptide (TPR) repeat protein
MGPKQILLILLVLVVCSSPFNDANSQDLRIEKVTDNIFITKHPEVGEAQLVIESEKGLVVLNSFWSEITARKYKESITEAFGRDDFYAVINMVDRLDMFGGNAAYREAKIIGHSMFWDKYKGKEKEVHAEIQDLIDMWRWKEKVSRERLATHEPGSEAETGEKNWMNTCKERADELETGFSLVPPTEVYDDRKILELGDIHVELIWFGRAGYDGMTVLHIPESKTAVIPGFIMHSHHLAPHPHNRYAKLDVPRWIAIFEELLEGKNKVDRVICDINNVWSPERAHTHLNYIRTLWNKVQEAEAAGKSLNEIQDKLSLDNEFAFVKDMQVYIDGGDDWIRPQHKVHVRLFFLQHKNMASEMIKERGLESLQATLAEIRNALDNNNNIYVDEMSFNEIGYYLLNSSKITEAIEVFKFNVETHPESFNTFDSLAEAYMKNGNAEDAIANYQKSLKLNPNNDNAKEKLKQLE